MAWTIILEDENREPVSSLNDEFDAGLTSNLSSFKLLCYLDPYGNTTFNHLQMDDLIKDLQNLKQMEFSPLLDKILRLAERCKKEAHTYLAFYGD